MDILALEKALNAVKLIMSLSVVASVLIGVGIAYCTVTGRSMEVK